MEGILDNGSPRRGSLSSLHRQSSGSFSHSLKLTSPGTNLQANNLYKDLDKYTRYFIIKTVQVIVQSRIGEDKRIRTECKPNGNDWFNINITDIPEVSERTKAALNTDNFSIRSNWRFCCEISLQTNDGGSVVLEHWIISNKTNPGLTSNLVSKLSNNQNAQKSHQATNRSSPVHLSMSNNGTIPLSAINNSVSTTPRIRTATFSNTSRSRLNSIDDCSSDHNSLTNKLLVGANNENFDIKSSTSCYSLSTTQPNQVADQINTIIASPSINSLLNNTAQGLNNAVHSSQQQSSSKANAMSSIYTIYNRMSLLLKTLMTTAHIVPAYRLASRDRQDESYAICYRVYSSPVLYQNTKASNSTTARGSIEDISYNTSDSPNRRSSSNSSFGSLNMREFVAPDEAEYFSPVLRLGTIRTEVNELEVSLFYRTDIKTSNQMVRNTRLKDMYSKILDEDCIVAAKQLLAGNDQAKNGAHTKDEEWDSNSNGSTCRDRYKNDVLSYIDQPLKPPFAAEDIATDKKLQDPNLELVESAFEGLLLIKPQSSNETITVAESCGTSNLDKTPEKKSSEPIQVPTGSPRSRQVELCQNHSSSSTPKSLTDSFVFVDLNPPFASEEQNDINSFFHGPSPAFSNVFDSSKDIDELTNQLAMIEANASQIDEFVDNICLSESEE